MKLAVVTGNSPSISQYTRCGFKVYGLEPQVIHYKGSTYEDLLMAKLI